MARRISPDCVSRESLKTWHSYLNALVTECGGTMHFVSALVSAFPGFTQACTNQSLLRRWTELETGKVSPSFRETVVVLGIHHRMFDDADTFTDLLEGIEPELNEFSCRMSG